jgi:hypothetical protein
MLSPRLPAINLAIPTIIVHIGLTDAINLILEVKDGLGKDNEDEAVAMLEEAAALISMVEAHAIFHQSETTKN